MVTGVVWVAAGSKGWCVADVISILGKCVEVGGSDATTMVE